MNETLDTSVFPEDTVSALNEWMATAKVNGWDIHGEIHKFKRHFANQRSYAKVAQIRELELKHFPLS